MPSVDQLWREDKTTPHLAHTSRRVVTMFMCGVLLHTASCTPPPPPTAVEIRIGVIGPFSGPLAESFGDPIVEGTRLALAEFEAAGGMQRAGRQVGIELPETAVAVCRRLRLMRDQVAC